MHMPFEHSYDSGRGCIPATPGPTVRVSTSSSGIIWPKELAALKRDMPECDYEQESLAAEADLQLGLAHSTLDLRQPQAVDSADELDPAARENVERLCAVQRAGEAAVEATGDAIRARNGTQVNARPPKIDIGGEVLVERTGHDAAGYCALRQVACNGSSRSPRWQASR
jgi:hypothetical protein